jgi:hypothetical protein
VVPQAATSFFASGPALTAGQQATLSKLKTAMAAATGNNPVTNADMASPPTITQSASHDGTLSVTATYGSNPTQFQISLGHNYLNSNGGLYVAGSNLSPATNGNLSVLSGSFTPTLLNGGENALDWTATFVTSSQVVELKLVISNSNVPYRFIVNQQYVARDGLITTSNFIKMDFGSRSLRTITIELQFGDSLQQVAVSSGETIVAPSGPVVSAAATGDSYCEGINGITDPSGVFYAMDSIGATFAKQIGVNSYRNTCVGGTGYWNQSGGVPGTRSNINGQMAFWSADFQYDTIWFMGGFNDSGQTSNANLQALALADWQLARLNNPNALIIVFGIWGGPRGPGASTIGAELALKSQYFAWGDHFSLFFPVSTDSTSALTWLYGTGFNGSGTQNAATYIASDDTHPNRPGAIYLGGRAATAYAAAINVLY